MSKLKFSLIQYLRTILHPPVSRDRAIELVREEFARRSIPWLDEPIRVQSSLRVYRVIVGGDLRGGSPCVSVDKRDGTILKFWVSPR